MLLLPMLFFPGCASRGEIKRFQAQMDSLTVINTMQKRHIERLDSLLLENARLLRAVRAEQNTNAVTLQEEMRIIQNILEDSGYKVSTLGERIETLEEDISRTAVSEDDTLDDKADTIDLGIDLRGDEIFSTARLDMNKGKYDLAMMGFESYLEQFPDGPLADEARYYIAEALLAKGEYTEAAVSFLTVTRKWPDSDLVPPSLYKAAYCYEIMEQNELAKQYYEQLLEEFPDSPESELARQRLEKEQ